MKTNHIKLYFVLITMSISNSSCKDFVTVDLPKSQLVAQTVFTSDKTATAAIAGLYSSIIASSTGSFINYQITLLGGLLSDEFITSTSNYQEFYQNNLLPTTTPVSKLWQDGYQYIYRSNAILEGLASATKLSPQVKSQLEGEAKFMRALCHFYLLGFYGHIPYLTSTDYTKNNQVSRLSVQQVYEMLVKDLQDASLLLPENYISTERTRPNKWTAAALLSRVYLYQKDYVNAEKTAEQIIRVSSLYNLNTNLNNVFLSNSKETIWQLKPSLPNYNTIEGSLFILNVPPKTSYLNPLMLKAFEEGDQRRKNWVDSLVIGADKWHYPTKYKVRTGSSLTEYYILFRLAEQYLIKAEAEAQQNKLNTAINDLDVIRERSGLVRIQDINPSISKPTLLQLILQERRTELFAEQGHRWLDLKRTGMVDEVLTDTKAPFWQPTDVLLPIPKSQIDNDPNMTQNPGYQ